MVDELWTSKQIIDYLQITMNNLRQLQFRKTIVWVKKEGKNVFYRAEDVINYKEQKDESKKKRDARKAV